jgi:hypothetical protein
LQRGSCFELLAAKDPSELNSNFKESLLLDTMTFSSDKSNQKLALGTEIKFPTHLVNIDDYHPRNVANNATTIQSLNNQMPPPKRVKKFSIPVNPNNNNVNQNQSTYQPPKAVSVDTRFGTSATSA